MSLWDVEAGTRLQRFDEHPDDITSLAFASSGTKMATGCRDRAVRVWRLDSAHPTSTLWGHAESIAALAWHPHREEIASASVDGTGAVHDPRLGHLVRDVPGDGHKFSAMSIVPGTSDVAMGTKTGEVFQFSARDETLRLVGRLRGAIRFIESDPSGTHICAVDAQGSARVWSADKEVRLADTLSVDVAPSFVSDGVVGVRVGERELCGTGTPAIGSRQEAWNRARFACSPRLRSVELSRAAPPTERCSFARLSS
jgi:WD40 repeat protein